MKQYRLEYYKLKGTNRWNWRMVAKNTRIMSGGEEGGGFATKAGAKKNFQRNAAVIINHLYDTVVLD